jgi:prephenate dehydrogenase
MSSGDPRQRVGIVGLGLVGGSVARSLKALDPAPRITGFTKDPEDARTALHEGILDVVAEAPDDAVRDQDVVIYATPLGATLELMATHSGLWGEAAVTDVVGLKKQLLDQARKRGFADVYVGAHPMVGGTGSGFAASVDDLFVDRTVWVVRGDAEAQQVERVEGLWRHLGARIKPIEAADHDELMVWASHLPQLMATALARVMIARGLEVTDLGTGGLDMTRLAMSSSDMWRDLLEVSADRGAVALEALEQELAALRAVLGAGDLDAIGAVMDQVSTWRTGS